MKRFFYYFGWMLVVFLVFYGGRVLEIRINEASMRSFAVMPTVLFTVLFPIILGVVLRLPKFILEIKEDKRWTFDWVKLLAVGLPWLYIIVMSILPFTPMFRGEIRIPQFVMIGGSTLYMLAGIILGYTLISSLKEK